MSTVRMRLLCGLLALHAAACGGGGGGAPSSPASLSPQMEAGGPPVFTASLVDPSDLDFILPLGHLNPPGHTLPTGHIYFYVGFLRRGIRGVPVYAPGDGTVQQILRTSAPDVKMWIRVNGTYMYTITHVVLDPEIREGTRLTAGQRLGISGPDGFGIDLGVMNFSRTHNFISPGRYPGDTLNADSPLRFYEEPLRSQLYSMVRRDAADKDGKIMFDVAGTLSGNWFHETLSFAESYQPTGWGRHLAFVYDCTRPSEPRVSIGGRLVLVGAFGTSPLDPPFESVRPESGLVTYTLRNGTGLDAAPGSSTSVATMLVQMLDPSRIRVEVFLGPASPGTFTSAAQVYVR